MSSHQDACYPVQAAIEAYGNGGFRFADMSHKGSILCLPDGMFAWPPTTPDELTPDAFTRLLAEVPSVGVLLLGTGSAQVFPSPELRKVFITAQIALEAMDTGAAARTYNVLLGEGRPIAAALLAVE